MCIGLAMASAARVEDTRAAAWTVLRSAWQTLLLLDVECYLLLHVSCTGCISYVSRAEDVLRFSSHSTHIAQLIHLASAWQFAIACCIHYAGERLPAHVADAAAC